MAAEKVFYFPHVLSQILPEIRQICREFIDEAILNHALVAYKYHIALIEGLDDGGMSVVLQFCLHEHEGDPKVASGPLLYKGEIKARTATCFESLQLFRDYLRVEVDALLSRLEADEINKDFVNPC